MSAVMRTTGVLPRRLWSQAASARLGAAIVATVTRRAFDAGLSVDDVPHRPYPGRAERVDLTDTGAMRRSLAVLEATATGVVVGLTGAPAIYGARVDDERPWIGISPGDARRLQSVITALVTEATVRGAP